ncbi:hypothetical protein HHK36_012782 [Tetracentron sinense]|uniref:Cellulose synthase-like protein G2 n=1 Tax=Tetracentron sinense TaxID=13715 RepID=A0A835DG12_TETSI|nr:hypothetical protein HHK36_012782 [Tetracentron sinense]
MATLSLHTGTVQQSHTAISRAHILFHFIAILALLYYRTSRLFDCTGDFPVFAWVLISTSELILSFIWSLTHPILPVASEKEPTVEVMNTVLSAKSLDYPPEKLSVYLSDDGGSSLTLYAIREASSFARSWIPFCRKYGIKTRCPEAFFSSLADDDHRLLRSDDFRAEEDEIKSKYELFKKRVETSRENGGIEDKITHPGQDRSPLIECDTTEVCPNSTAEVIQESSKEGEYDDHKKMPLLVYVSRVKRPSYPHRFKAGALNALLRVSGIMSNSPYILVLDCDMYCNDPTSARQAMCFHLDPQISHSLAFVQFPQIFYNVSKNDIYDGQARSAYKTKWQGMDGLRGPVLSGTGFYLKRLALYGSPKQQGNCCLEPERSFGPSNQFITSLRENYECNANKDSSEALLQESRLLASCDFETGTEWGEQASFSYNCMLESTFTGHLLHCKGWTSVYCYPTRPCFLGCTTIDMKDALVQLMKWSSGLFQVGLSRFSPLTYGMSRMSILQSMCYGYFTFQPLYSIALLLYGTVPQLCLLKAIPLYPKISDPWLAVFAIVYVSSLSQHLYEVLSSGGSIRTLWNEQRIWIIKSVTANLFGLFDVLMKWIGLKKANFRLTNKVIDKAKLAKYEKGGVRLVIMDTSYDEMFGQVFLSFFILVLSYPIIEGMITRKGKGGL